MDTRRNETVVELLFVIKLKIHRLRNILRNSVYLFRSWQTACQLAEIYQT